MAPVAVNLILSTLITAGAAWGQTGLAAHMSKIAPSDYRASFQTWQLFTTRDGLPSNRIHAIHVFKEQLWIGTDLGLVLLQHGHWTMWTAEKGLPWPSISAIAVAPDTHDVWLGTWGGGLIRLTGGRFDVFDQMNSGLAGNFVFSVLVVGDRVWAATNSGLSVFDPVEDEWELHAERRADSAQAAIVSMASDGSSLFVAAWCAGLREFSLGESRWRSVVRPALPTRDSALAESPAGSAPTNVCAYGGILWAVTPDSIWRRDRDGDWQARSLGVEGRLLSNVNCVAAQGESDAWLGTDDGLQILADWPSDRWILFRCTGASASSNGQIVTVEAGNARETYEARCPIPTGRITSLAFARGGAWVGSDMGLFYCEVNPVHQSSPRHSQVNRTIASISPDRLSGEAAPAERASVRTARIGAAGSFTRTIRLPGQTKSRPAVFNRADVDAIRSALDHVNATGHGDAFPRFELVMELGGFAKYGWGTPEDDIALFAHFNPVLGIVGHLGPSDRILSAVLMRTRIPFVNTSSTPIASVETDNPCVVRCNANDPRLQRMVLEHALRAADGNRVAILRTSQPDSLLHLNWWAGQIRAMGHLIVIDSTWDPKGEGVKDLVQEVAALRPSVVLTWTDACSSAHILRRIREAGVSPVFVGSDRIVCDDFSLKAGADCESVFASFPCRHRLDSPPLAGLKSDPRKPSPLALSGLDDVDAMLSWDATMHLCEAISRAEECTVDSVQKALTEMRESPVAIFENGHWHRHELRSITSP